MTGHRVDFPQKIYVIKEDPAILFPEGDQVEFRGQIREKIVSVQVKNVEIVTIDLSPGLRRKNKVSPGSMRIQGRQNLISSLGTEQYTFTVDCSSIEGPGVYILDLVPAVPSSIAVLEYEPDSVRLEILGTRKVRKE